MVQGGLALSWLEPALRLGPHFSILSTLQLVDIDFGVGTSTTFGFRVAGKLGGFTLAAGPRFSVNWYGGTAWGGEVDLLVLQERVGVAVGVRQFGTENNLFVALTIADVNGMLYWLTPWAPREKVNDPARQPH